MLTYMLESMRYAGIGALPIKDDVQQGDPHNTAFPDKDDLSTGDPYDS